MHKLNLPIPFDFIGDFCGEGVENNACLALLEGGIDTARSESVDEVGVDGTGMGTGTGTGTGTGSEAGVNDTSSGDVTNISGVD